MSKWWNLKNPHFHLFLYARLRKRDVPCIMVCTHFLRALHLHYPWSDLPETIQEWSVPSLDAHIFGRIIFRGVMSLCYFSAFSALQAYYVAHGGSLGLVFFTQNASVCTQLYYFSFWVSSWATNVSNILILSIFFDIWSHHEPIPKIHSFV